MSHICNTKLKVLGTQQQLDAFREQYIRPLPNNPNEPMFSFSFVIPEPDFTDDEANDRIAWRNQNWGTN